MIMCSMIMCSLDQPSAKPSPSACTATRRIASGPAFRPICGKWIPTRMSYPPGLRQGEGLVVSPSTFEV
jgi:hypothetical protein